jgi:hypothetical protein
MSKPFMWEFIGIPSRIPMNSNIGSSFLNMSQYIGSYCSKEIRYRRSNGGLMESKMMSSIALMFSSLNRVAKSTKDSLRSYSLALLSIENSYQYIRGTVGIIGFFH